MRAPLLQFEAVALALGRQRFGPFSLRLQAGERVAILGPSGAGKSTLLKLMARDSRPEAGQLWLRGRALADWPLAELSRQRAVLPQSGEVAFGLATELVVGLGRVARAHDPELVRIVEAAAAQAHASHLLGRRFDTLSGGEQARVQMARVLAQLWDAREGLILVDEPLAALDPGLQFELLDSLLAYAQARGHAVVAILHDLNQALAGFERLWLVKQGRLQADLAADVRAVPALEALYDLPLSCFTDAQGDVVVAPQRRRARA